MKDSKSKRKRIVVIIGASAGAILSLVTSLLMDLLFADSLQGTWREAIVNDLENVFSITMAPDSVVVYLLFILVMVFLSLIGAGIGAFFALIVYKFISFLES